MAKPADGKKRKGGKKNRKHLRNKKWCESYKANNVREFNKVRKLVRHIKAFPNDFQAVNAWRRVTGMRKKYLKVA